MSPLSSLGEWSSRGLGTPLGEASDRDVVVKKTIHKVRRPEGVRLRWRPSIRCGKGPRRTSPSARGEGVVGSLSTPMGRATRPSHPKRRARSQPGPRSSPKNKGGDEPPRPFPWNRHSHRLPNSQQRPLRWGLFKSRRRLVLLVGPYPANTTPAFGSREGPPLVSLAPEQPP